MSNHNPTMPESPLRVKESLNQGWSFYRGDRQGTLYGQQWERFGDVVWEAVDLPHTFTYTDFSAREWYRGVGWYHKSFVVPAEDDGKRITLFFEGAMTVADVWINGHKLDTHYGGFTPFCYDITDYMHFGEENVIAVKVDNRYQYHVPPEKPDGSNIGFCLFGGIYRNVFLITSDKLHIPEAVHAWNADWVEQGGVNVITTEVDADSATVQAQSWVKNGHDTEKRCTVVSQLVDANGAVVSAQETAQTINPGQVLRYTHEITVAHPDLWYPWSPYLYTLNTIVKDGETPVDEYRTRVGIRKLEWTRDRGCFINGQPLKILGANRHQMYPFVGNALPDRQQYLDALDIKNAGFNCVRHHYLANDSFMDACDELGLLVFAELPGWGNTSMANFGELWDLWVAHNQNALRATIRHARHRPSLMMWGAGINEMHQCLELEVALHAVAKSEDPTRPTTQARNYTTNNNVFDVFGANIYTPESWDYSLGAGNPDPDSMGLLNTEYMGTNYAVWREDAEAAQIDNCLRNVAMIEKHRQHPWVHGGIIWEMYDHYHPVFVLRNHGVSDVRRLPKFAYYLYQSQAAIDNYEGSAHPMVFIANYWTPTSPTDVTVFSNCEEVRLSVWRDGAWAVVETRRPDDRGIAHPPFTFPLGAHDTSAIKAEALIGGVVMATDIRREPGAPAALRLETDTTTLSADGTDFARITVTVLDADGTVVPYATHDVTFAISGPGLLIGDNPVTTKNAREIILARANHEPGVVTVTATAPGLESADVAITIRATAAAPSSERA